MPFTIRPATESDRAAILSLMRPGDYNRINLKPGCFLAAEEAGRVIGIGQVKRHRDGAWELASLVVAADWRGQGVGGALVQALSARHTGELYLLCLAQLEGYYERFGFRRAAPHTLPRTLARMVWAGNVIGRAPVVFGRARLRVIAMRRHPSHEPNN